MEKVRPWCGQPSDRGRLKEQNRIVFDPLLTGHVIRRMRSGRVRIFNSKFGNQWETLGLYTRNSRTDRRRVFILGVKVGHVTRHVRQLFKVKRSKVKVTRSRTRNLRCQGLALVTLESKRPLIVVVAQWKLYSE